MSSSTEKISFLVDFPWLEQLVLVEEFLREDQREHGTEFYLTTQSRSESDEGLTLETSAFESLYGGQFTLSTQLIKPN